MENIINSSLPDTAQLWIWQSANSLQAVKDQIAASLSSFCQQWFSHGAEVTCEWSLVDDHFLVIAATTTDRVSGCSTDGLQRFILAMQQELGINLQDRMLAGIKADDGVIAFFPMSMAKKAALPANYLSGQFYDTTLSNVGALRAGWPVAVQDSWLASKWPTLALG